MKTSRFGTCILFVCLAVHSIASAGWYVRSLPDSVVVEIRGEAADSTGLGADRYLEDNLDYLIETEEWLVVNFSAFWCPDSDVFAPAFREAADMDERGGIRWAYAEVDGTIGNESFRTRFDLPGVPTVILFHDGEIATDSSGVSAILDGSAGDKTFDDLVTFLQHFYKPVEPPSTDTGE